MLYTFLFAKFIDAYFKSRQQQRGYDGQKEYFKRKNVTDWNVWVCYVCHSGFSTFETLSPVTW